jgi:hypothetical protein
MRPAGMMFPGKGWPVVGSTITIGLPAPSTLREKSPPRSASVGTRMFRDEAWGTSWS